MPGVSPLSFQVPCSRWFLVGGPLRCGAGSGHFKTRGKQEGGRLQLLPFAGLFTSSTGTEAQKTQTQVISKWLCTGGQNPRRKIHLCREHQQRGCLIACGSRSVSLTVFMASGEE